jgi:hypothetical protein
MNKANTRVEKQDCIAIGQKTRNLILMAPCLNWLWTVTTEPV